MAKTFSRTAITAYLDRILSVASIPDDSINGLQVAGAAKVSAICCAVDAGQEAIAGAIALNSQLLIVHHGLLWKSKPVTITGIHRTRLALLLEHNISLYAAHLPLDLHPRLGNNRTLARRLQLQGVRPFGSYHGVVIGTGGQLAKRMALNAFVRHYERRVGGISEVIAGSGRVKKVGIVSGGGAGLFDEFQQGGFDTFITGEHNYTIVNIAKESGVNLIFGGHYRTEVFGVQQLALALAKRFKGLKTEFIDIPSTV